MLQHGHLLKYIWMATVSCSMPSCLKNSWMISLQFFNNFIHNHTYHPKNDPPSFFSSLLRSSFLLLPSSRPRKYGDPPQITTNFCQHPRRAIHSWLVRLPNEVLIPWGTKVIKQSRNNRHHSQSLHKDKMSYNKKIKKSYQLSMVSTSPVVRLRKKKKKKFMKTIKWKSKRWGVY